MILKIEVYRSSEHDEIEAGIKKQAVDLQENQVLDCEPKSIASHR